MNFPAIRLVFCALAILGVGSSPSRGADEDPGSWRLKVHPRVLQEAGAGPAEFIVFLDEQADLGFASAIPAREARGRAVTDALRRTAAASQEPLIELLVSRGAEHRAFWIANMIWVRGDESTLASIAAVAEVRRIDANPRVSFSLPDSLTEESARRSLASIEWNIQKVLAPQVWALGYDGSGVVIAGQDTGYDWEHEALKGKYRGWDGATADHDYNWHDAIHTGGGSCGADSPFPCDDHFHGTHTMGTMVGDDGGANQIGMSPGATWIGCRNMDQGAGTPATYAECFEWFVAPTDLNGENPDPSKAPHVINNSWLCPPDEGCSPDALETVVQNTRAAGIVVVVSAGNSGSSCSSIENPAAIYASSFSVGATDDDDEIAGFSSRGPVTVDGSGRLKPNVSAPGVHVRSSMPGDNYSALNGTSMAGPHVAGLVALLFDARPDLIGQVEEVENLIEASAVRVNSAEECGGIPGTEFPNNTYGHGRIDALEALLGDADDDGQDNLTDCRPVDSGTWAPPAPVVDLALAQAGPAETVLAWSAPTEAGASVVHYDVLRSEKPEDFLTAICLSSSEAATGGSDEELPVEIFYYLVRVTNRCSGSLGSGSGGLPREGVDCLQGGS
jgi:serine protease AprX